MSAKTRARALNASRVLRYQHREVIRRFSKDWHVPEREARQLFDDVKRFLWLTTRTRYSIAPAARAIDEMWHTFLLFTRDYERFCKRYLGKMVHHVPATSRELAAVARRRVRNPARWRKGMLTVILRERRLALVHFGEPTMTRWYETYQHRYAKGFFDRRVARDSKGRRAIIAAKG